MAVMKESQTAEMLGVQMAQKTAVMTVEMMDLLLVVMWVD